MLKQHNPFHRVTTSGSFIPEVDGFRFIAISSVVFFHLFQQLHRYYKVQLPVLLDLATKNGERGVQLFFVISGFILALPFARHHLLGSRKVSLRHYFLRRLTRLEPPYAVALFTLAILTYFIVHTPATETATHLLASMAYLHNQIFAKPSSIAVVAWSLEVEIQFYILVPGLTLLFHLRNSILRRAILAGSILLLGLFQSTVEAAFALHFQLSLGYYLQFFLSGFLLADLFLSRNKSQRRRPWAWDLVSLLGWPAVYLLPNYGIPLVLPFLILGLYWAAFQGQFFKHILSRPLITSIGGMCYTIYLVHYSLIAFATRSAGHSRPIVMFLLALIMIGSVSCVYFLAIEKPCMNPVWPQLLLKKARSLRLVRRPSEQQAGRRTFSRRRGDLSVYQTWEKSR